MVFGIAKVQQQKEMAADMVRDYQSAEMPLTFRVQPMQPNLHQTM